MCQIHPDAGETYTATKENSADAHQTQGTQGNTGSKSQRLTNNQQESQQHSSVINRGSSTGLTDKVLYTSQCSDKKPDIPIFRMKIKGKEVDALFNTGSTVNILDYKTLVNHLEMPKQFIQNKDSRIGGITGQKVSNIGNVQL